MRIRSALYSAMAMLGIAVFLAAGQARSSAQPGADSLDRIGSNDLGGVVTGANGPEAGVWVIAETSDLPTKFAKIVVTDDRGRYVMPDLHRPVTAFGCVATGWSTRRRCDPRRAES